MDLTDSDIQDFIEAWQKDFGEVLSRDQARSEATRLLHFYEQVTDAFGGLPDDESVKDGTMLT